jgi:ABC-2 type transport system ATP-binding protein
MNSVIEITDLKKSYKRKINETSSIFRRNQYEEVHALDGISFQIKAGERVGFVGLNGAGKSTTIKLLTGILYPDAGEVKLFGRDSYKHRKRNAENIGVMFGQRSHLLWDLPFRNSLELLKKVYGVSDEAYKTVIEQADAFLEIKALLNVPIRSMSLGQRMKCEFTAITLHQPKVFVLDEPTIGLDIMTKKQIKNYLTFLNEITGATVFLTTHDLSEIEKLCDRIIVLNEGRVLIDGSMDQVVHMIDATFASIQTKEAFDKAVLKPFDTVSVLDEKAGTVKIRIQLPPEDAKGILAELMQQMGIAGVTVYAPSLEDMLFYLLQKAGNDYE